MARGLGIIVGGVLLFVAMMMLAFKDIDGRIRIGVAAVALGGIALLLWLDNWRVAAEKKKAKESAEARLKELTAQAERPNFELAVSGSKQFAPAVGLTVLGVVFLLMGASTQNLWLFLAGLPFSLGAVLLFLRLVPSIGLPMLVMNRSGFKTPLTPHLSWQRIDGLFLLTMEMKGVVTNQLFVQIGVLPQIIQEFGLFHRLMFPLIPAKRRDRFAIDLRGSSEDPQVVYRMMRLLWTKSTGRDYDWNPNVSAEVNAAVRKLKESSDRLGEFVKPGAPLPSDEEIKKVMKDIGASSAVTQKEAKRQARNARWAVIAAIVFGVAYVLVKLSKLWR